MADRATGINPEMLRWARERAGYATVESVAARLKRPVEQIEAWETGSEFPTWRQFERMARNVYRRPAALFFLSSPPVEKSLFEEFERLPKAAIEDLEPDTWFAVRHAKARRMDLEELASFDNSQERQILKDLGVHIDHTDAVSLAVQIREYLKIDLDSQLSWPTEQVALENWRSAVQDAGVWVFKRRFRQNDIAGFCLYDQNHPLIYLNNRQSVGRQLLTLFNLLAHLIFRTSHLERRDVDGYVEALEGQDRDIEVTSNQVATDFLIPTEHFLEYVQLKPAADSYEQVLISVARKYRVGKEIALRKYLDQGVVDACKYHEKLSEWHEVERQESVRSGGGNFYAIQRANLGAKFTSLVFRGYYQGAIEVDQLVEYLEIRPPTVVNLENWENWLFESFAPR